MRIQVPARWANRLQIAVIAVPVLMLAAVVGMCGKMVADVHYSSPRANVAAQVQPMYIDPTGVNLPKGAIVIDPTKN